MTNMTPPKRPIAVSPGAAGSILLGVLTLLIAGCDAEKAKTEPHVPFVRVVKAEVTPDRLSATSTGEIRAHIDSNLSFNASGRIKSRQVDVGDHVKAGQVLAALDPAEQIADVRSATAAVAAQEAALRVARSVLERRKTLAQSGTVSQQSLDDAVQQYQSAESGLASAKAALAITQDSLNQTELKADADGIITARNVEVGQVVQPSTTVFTLAHDGGRDAIFDVEEVAINRDQAPSSVEVSLVSRPTIVAKARVTEISPVVDQSHGTVRVKLAIDNVPPEMTLGSAVMARVDTDNQSNIKIPWRALSSIDGRPALWVVDGGTNTASLKAIEIQRYEADDIVVASGLSEGQIVITDGGKFLSQGQTVSFNPEDKP